jgi:ABC-2 type transport system permease protein
MSDVLLLLWPKWRTVVNSGRDRRGRWKALALLVLVAAACAAIYFGAHHVFRYIRDLDVGFSPELEFKELRFQVNLRLLNMAVITFMAVLLFSNIITALTTFFLSDDLQLVGSLPVSPDAVFLARFGEMLVDSSWMVVVFGTPVFAAFGSVYEAGWYYYAAIPLLLLPFLLAPAGLGVMVTMALVSAFPARRIRDVLLLLTILAAAVLFMLLRMLQPEKLVSTDTQLAVLDLINTLRGPVKAWMPNYWVAETLGQLAQGRLAASGRLYLALLWTTGPGLLALTLLLARTLYPEAFSKSLEASRIRISRTGTVNRLVGLVSAPFSAAMRQMVMKDIRVFMRDTTQWSQLFLLAALMVIYIFNVRVLPLPELGGQRLYLTNLVSYLNISLAGFVIAALAARFVFPMVSLEGKAFWIVKTSPLPLAGFLWSKFLMSAVPLCLIGEFLVIVTNHLLEVDPVVRVVGMGTIFGMTFAISGLGVGLGARYPKFQAENPAKVATSFGGVLYMVLALGMIAAVVALEAAPTYYYFMGRQKGMVMSLQDMGYILACLAGVAVVLSVSAIWPMRLGLRALEEMELH